MPTVRYTVIDGEIIAENRNGIRRQYVPDPLGSTAALLDSSQYITDQFRYWPYGAIYSRIGSTPTPFRYVGTHGYFACLRKLTYVRARYLNKELGRWITDDPRGFDGSDVNLGQYTSNNPVTFFDFTGLLQVVQNWPYNVFPFHQYIRFDRPCKGSYTYGFFPNGWDAVYRKDGHGIIIGDQIPSGPRKGDNPSQDTLHNDPSAGRVRDTIERSTNDPIFSNALCDCIKQSILNRPDYDPYKYTCQTWVWNMWECAKKKLGWPPSQRSIMG